MSKKWLSVVLAVVAIGFVAPMAMADTINASASATGGPWTGTGTSGDPYGTIQMGLVQAFATAGSHTVSVAAGTYSGYQIGGASGAGSDPWGKNWGNGGGGNGEVGGVNFEGITYGTWPTQAINVTTDTVSVVGAGRTSTILKDTGATADNSGLLGRVNTNNVISWVNKWQDMTLDVTGNNLPVLGKPNWTSYGGGVYQGLNYNGPWYTLKNTDIYLGSGGSDGKGMLNRFYSDAGFTKNAFIFDNCNIYLPKITPTQTVTLNTGAGNTYVQPMVGSAYATTSPTATGYLTGYNASSYFGWGYGEPITEGVYNGSGNSTIWKWNGSAYVPFDVSSSTDVLLEQANAGYIWANPMFTGFIVPAAPPPPMIPEPATLALLGLGCLMALRRRG